MTFEKNFITQKIEQMTSYLEEIEEFFRFSNEEILKYSEKLHIAERLLQLIVDTMIDINEHFINELGFKSSDDYQGTFKILSENNILSKDFALKIAPVVGVRNRIVHRYEEINQERFIKDFRNNLGDFKEYLKYINNYLQKTA